MNTVVLDEKLFPTVWQITTTQRLFANLTSMLFVNCNTLDPLERN